MQPDMIGSVVHALHLLLEPTRPQSLLGDVLPDLRTATGLI
jgi:hypothetical protein